MIKGISIEPGAEAAPLDETEVRLVKRVLSDPTAFPAIFKTWVTNWMEAAPPISYINQLHGYTSILPQAARLDGEISWDSTAYADPNLVTGPGPELTGLGPGKYIVDFGAGIQAEGAQTIFLSVAVNGVMPPDDSNCIESLADLLVPAASSFLTTLTEQSNSLRIVYRCGGSTGHTARRRWIKAVKYGER